MRRPFAPGTSPTFHYVAALLRLGTKYDIDNLRSLALLYFTSHWPDTLPGYIVKPFDKSYTYTDHPDDIIELVNLALETNCLVILPAAYYSSYLSTDELFTSDPPLSPENIRRIVTGRERLRQQEQSGIWSWMAEQDVHGCTSPTRCNVESYASAPDYSNGAGGEGLSGKIYA